MTKNKKSACMMSLCALLFPAVLVLSLILPPSSKNPYKFVTYEPSKAELDWNRSIYDARRSWPSIGCPKIMASLHENEASRQVFSRGRTLHGEPIEPLIGTLRHPDTACSLKTAFSRKDWVMLHKKKQKSKLFIMVDEKGKISRKEAESQMQSLFHLNNISLEDVISSHTFTKNLTEEYYIVALFQDFPDAFLQDDAFTRSLDELFLDHRTLGSPMMQIWGTSAFESGKDITDTYMLLTKLRSRGIRAHAYWA